MNTTLTYLLSHRMWLVENVVVWGSISSYIGSFLLTEDVGGERPIYLWQADIGGNVQEIAFENLVDNRGNSLPSTISRPKVVILPKSGVHVVVLGRETNASFRLAKTESGVAPGVVDLLVIEMRE